MIGEKIAAQIKFFVLCSILIVVTNGYASVEKRAPASSQTIEQIAPAFKELCENSRMRFGTEEVSLRLGAPSRSTEIVSRNEQAVDLNCNFDNINAGHFVSLARLPAFKAICPTWKMKNREGYPPNQDIGDVTQSDYGPGAGTLYCCFGCPSLD